MSPRAAAQSSHSVASSRLGSMPSSSWNILHPGVRTALPRARGGFVLAPATMPAAYVPA